MNFYSIKTHTVQGPRPRVVVRVTTTAWKNERGVHLKKSLTFLRRQCIGHNFFEEDADNIGSEELFERIVNLHTVKDGVYDVVLCNCIQDYESGYVEDCSYKLVKVST